VCVGAVCEGVGVGDKRRARRMSGSWMDTWVGRGVLFPTPAVTQATATHTHAHTHRHAMVKRHQTSPYTPQVMHQAPHTVTGTPAPPRTQLEGVLHEPSHPKRRRPLPSAPVWVCGCVCGCVCAHKRLAIIPAQTPANIVMGAVRGVGAWLDWREGRVMVEGDG
jgi:hypothetical protein